MSIVTLDEFTRLVHEAKAAMDAATAMIDHLRVENGRLREQRDAAAARLVVEESWRFHGDGNWIWPKCAANVRRNLTVDSAEAARLAALVFGESEGAGR